ncbi:MAG: hypothetical protein ACD_55C00166G0002 [uncultured bacterium]|uniref:Uncharacterized protein n=1 Tax=Citrifermentans bemidjiense (strain ATCC BAA-1014 / DSM 16622 / JCM 12645 / Bem) TaxID=404380 RepID=B5EG64_CITBB|nr:hypothetical protein [Citrifermentans bemidjiense]ACH40977.1 hypothetical protein Gbem_3985 [Citrifermentans bemidjiense Bem]EKD59097.1 MAG: hypothetical protein ACD_55C00166G0002 [uncultured bacterium]
MPTTKLSLPELLSKSAAMNATFNTEMFNRLLSLIPTPAFYSELHERYATNFAGYLRGDPEKIKACEEDRQLIDQNLSLLLGLAKVVTAKDPSLQEAFGLNPSAERATVSATLERAKDFRVSFDPKGHPAASVTKIMGARGYEIWACDGDPSLEENWRLVVWSTKCLKIPIIGVDRTKLNWLRIRGKRGETAGPWSNPIPLNP